MANNIITPNIVAKEALMILESNMMMHQLVHTDYSKEFAQVGDTVTIRKPATFSAKNFVGSVSTQDITESRVDVKLDRHKDVTVSVTSKEMTLDVSDFSEQVIRPAVLAICESVDTDVLATGLEGAGTMINSTENPTNLADIAALAKALDKNKAPIANRSIVFGPDHKYKYALTDNLSKVSYAGDNETLRKSLMGSLYGMDSYMDQNAPMSLAAAAGSMTAAKASGTAGATSLSMTNCTPSAGTLKAGDGLIIEGRMYRVAADATASSGSATVTIDQPLHATISAVTVKPVISPSSLAFHRNGIAFVTRPLELPAGAGKAAIASAKGLSIRVVYDYDTIHKVDTISFDVLYGVKTLDSNLMAALVG